MSRVGGNKNSNFVNRRNNSEYDYFVKTISSYGKKRFSEIKRYDKIVKEALNNGINADALIDGMIKFEDLFERGRRACSLPEYIKAIEFCTYVVSGLGYSDAYRKCFPDRCEFKELSYVSASASQYSGSIIVSNMLSRIYLNQHIFFIDKVINAKMELYKIGTNESVSDRNRVDALDKFLTHTKKVEDRAGIDVQVNIQNNSIDILDKKLDSLANLARGSIKLGNMTPTEVIESKTEFVNE